MAPKYVAKVKRAIAPAEHAAITQREQNSERRNFYELLWHMRNTRKSRTTIWRLVGQGRLQGSPLFSVESELGEAELAGDEVEHGDQVRG
jgi:hypothetical protein